MEPFHRPLGMSETEQNLEAFLFEAAVQKTDAIERAAFLDAACRGNLALRARLDLLLEGHFRGEGFLTREPERPTVVAPTVVSEEHARMIGRYKLLEKIGEGGFGEVWMADQREPVKRRVAIKIIKLGMDTRQVVGRFEAERQALALMDHPNIAKVFDAGATEAGRPYFVMELVRGIRITDYCDQNQLPTSERLKLFTQVCHAIQHAHQKGIIHRDIKPSNILVTLHDGVPVPKVIDFGIAKATQQELTDKTVFTQFQQFIGTPAYISPEQAEMSGLDIDTRADIYSLGVLLYELLVGQTPFDAKEMMKDGIDALRQIIREKEPLRPSTRLNTLPGEARTTAGKRRHTDVSKLVHQLQGDLDWIVMKCLEKDRTRRYDTANGLAMDIQRHLANEPVVARPPTAAYKLQKAFRRNKLAFAAGAAVVAALIVGLTISSWQMIVARRARNNEAVQRTKAEASEKLAAASARGATASLYSSLLGQAHATRIARQVGYREEVFDLLRKARDLHTPAKQLAGLRLEAVASMGDFVGFRPRQIASAPAINRLEGMRLSPDGRLLALHDMSGIQLHELPSGREVGRWRLEHPVREFAFNGAGDRLITIDWPADPGGIIRSVAGARVTEFALNLAGKWQQAASRPMPGAFTCVSISNSAFVLVGDSWPIRQLHLVEVGSWRTVHSLQQSEGSWGPKVAATRDGQKLALMGNADSGNSEPQIEIWDLPREQLLRRLPPGFSTDASVAFSEEGRYLLSLAKQGTRIYETTTFRVVDEFSGYADSFDFGSFLPGTPLVAVPRPQQRRFLIRDYQKGETVAVLEEAAMSIAAAFAPGGEFLLTLNSTGVNLYSLAGADECLTLAGHRVSVPGIAFSPDGTRLASVAKDRTVAMWDSSSGRQIWEGDQLLLGPGQAVCFSPDGKLLATGDWETRLIQLWDTESGRQLLQLTSPTGRRTWGLQFVADPQHGLLLVRKGGDVLGVWHIGPTRPVLDRDSGAVRWMGSRSSLGDGVVAAPDGKRIAFGSDFMSSKPRGYSTIIQDPLGEKPPLALVRGTSGASVPPMLFTPDGRSVVVLTTENQVAVFDAATGELRRTFAITGSSISGRNLVLSHTARWLAVTAPSMRGVDIYDFATGDLRYSLPDREGTVYWLAWHPKEPRLAIARDNGDIALWDLAKIDRQLAELGLGFAPADVAPAQDKP
jgi:WD40 repeat protein/tRNA A-37 threonylcarbamoyl transferase component Bud32